MKLAHGPSSRHWPKGSKESERDFWSENACDGYCNFQAKVTSEALKELADKYRTFEWIPKQNGWHRANDSQDAEVKHPMTSKYGWPDNFKHKQFAEDRERFW